MKESKRHTAGYRSLAAKQAFIRGPCPMLKWPHGESIRTHFSERSDSGQQKQKIRLTFMISSTILIAKRPKNDYLSSWRAHVMLRNSGGLSSHS